MTLKQLQLQLQVFALVVSEPVQTRGPVHHAYNLSHFLDRFREGLPRLF
jgi:hypothetical protein